MIKNLLLNIQKIWIIFMKIMKNTVQTKNEKHWLYLIATDPIVTELFLTSRKLNVSLVFYCIILFCCGKRY